MADMISEVPRERNRKMKKLMSVAAVVAAAVAFSACTPGPKVANPPPPTCSITNIENVASHRITITGTSSIASGQEVRLDFYGNGAPMFSVSSDVGHVGAISETLDLPQYGYNVGWEGFVVYQGRTLCSATYTDFTGEIPPEWIETWELFPEPNWWYGN